MKNTHKLSVVVRSIAIIALFTGIAFVFAACDNGSGAVENTYESLILKGKDAKGGDVEVEFSTTRTIARAVLNPANGDNYEIRLNGRVISRGYIEILNQYVIFNSLTGERFYSSYIGDLMTLPEVPDADGGSVTGIRATSSGIVPSRPPQISNRPYPPVDDGDGEDNGGGDDGDGGDDGSGSGGGDDGGGSGGGGDGGDDGDG